MVGNLRCGSGDCLSRHDDNNLHRPRGKRTPRWLLTPSVLLEGQHIQVDVQGDAHLLPHIHAHQHHLSSGSHPATDEVCSLSGGRTIV